MSFIKFLQGIGDRLGILETVSVPGPQAAKRVQTRSVSLRELTIEIQSEEIRALAEAPAEFSVPFDRIFETAGIVANPQEWSIDRLKQVVAGESLQNKPRDDVQRAVLEILNAEGVSVEKIVKDAIARDQAMDAYEAFVGEKMRARMELRQQKRREIEARIRDLQEEQKAMETSLKAEEQQWRDWKKEKRLREKELAFLVGYLVNHTVITFDEKDDA